MGYIASSSTLAVVAYLTQRGRELLLTGTEADITTTQFSLGDSDANYNVAFGLDTGFVPDLTGENSGCTISIAQNIGIRSNVIRIGEVDNLKEVRIQRNDGSWVTSLRCLIHLDKLARYNLAKNIRNTVVNNNFLDTQQLSPFADFYQHISVFESKNGVDLSQTDEEVHMDMLFDPTFFTRMSETWVKASPSILPNQYTLSEGLNNRTQTQIQFVNSPLMFAFSSLADSSNTSRIGGAGKGGIIIYGREIGYLVNTYTLNGGNKISISGYPTFKLPSEVEGISFNLESGNTKTEIIPSVRIRSIDDTTGIVLTEKIYNIEIPSNVSLSTSFFTSSNEAVAFNNQYTKLYKNSLTNLNSKGIIYDETTNLKEFIRSTVNRDLFQLLPGSSTEYRSVPLKFLVKSSDSTAKPAVLEIILKYDDTVVLGSQTDYLLITGATDTNFIDYL